MIITALTENTAMSERFGCEHGLSLYIQTNRHRILFDMGQSNLFEHNAALLGVDLSAVDLAVLSHGHYDHGGGLVRFLELNQKAPVYLSRYAFETHYNASGKYIGLDPAMQGNPRLIAADDNQSIDEGITLLSCGDKEPLCPIDADGLTVTRGEERIADDFRHELVMLLEEDGKRVLISGCSHKGVINYAAWLKPDVLVGGFHFMHTPIGDKLLRYAEKLDRCDTEFCTCHCTGAEQYAFLKQHMRRLRYLSAGDTLTL